MLSSYSSVSSCEFSFIIVGERADRILLLRRYSSSHFDYTGYVSFCDFNSLIIQLSVFLTDGKKDAEETRS